jgi:hypothetical protein
MNPQLLKLFYQLRAHRIGEWSVDRVLVTLAWAAAVFVLLRWVLAGQPALAVWHWLVLAVLVLGGLAVIVMARIAAHQDFVVFTVQPDLPAPQAMLLDPHDKVQTYATGHFEVEGKAGFFAELLAYWRTFATREHAVMAIVHRTRFLGLARTADAQLGMWYIFIAAENVEEVSAGELQFGGERRPALRITYRYTPARPAGRSLVARLRPPPTHWTVYLGFEDDASRRRVWSDVLVDPAGL